MRREVRKLTEEHQPSDAHHIFVLLAPDLRPEVVQRLDLAVAQHALHDSETLATNLFCASVHLLVGRELAQGSRRVHTVRQHFCVVEQLGYRLVVEEAWLFLPAQEAERDQVVVGVQESSSVGVCELFAGYAVRQLDGQVATQEVLRGAKHPISHQRHDFGAHGVEALLVIDDDADVRAEQVQILAMDAICVKAIDGASHRPAEHNHAPFDGELGRQVKCRSRPAAFKDDIVLVRRRFSTAIRGD